MAMGIAEIYRRSKKPKDPFWNEWVSRPVAAVFVYALKDTRLTPNQITFLSLFVALSVDAVLLLWREYAGLVAAAVLLQLAFVLDCTDGQLARIRGTSSPLGGYLDFLMDEIKAVALVAAVAGRLGWQDPARRELWLGLGLAGVVVVSSGISLTTFMRRQEYVVATARPGGPGDGQGGRRSLLSRAVALAEWGGKFVVNYPGWFWGPALLGRIEYFLVPYLVANLLYLGRSGLTVLWRLGR
jgi:phosphatidylglycerophosphate synthase